MNALSKIKEKFTIDLPMAFPILGGALAVSMLVNGVILNPSQTIKASSKEFQKKGISTKVKEILKTIESVEEDGKVYQVLEVLGEDGKVYRAIENRSETLERGKDDDLFISSYIDEKQDTTNIIRENKETSITGFVYEDMMRFD